ncbi:MAG: hypothetical protein PWR19_1826 [Carnobacterium sp.]|nr:hypothetical protein [Carnobacterium sp.]
MSKLNLRGVKMKRIGYTNDSYPERRTIIDGNLHPIKRVKSYNTYLTQAAMKRIPVIGKKVDTFFYEKFLTTKEVDGFHFSNSVTDSNVPWIATFETYIPRTTALAFLDDNAENKKKKNDLKKVESYIKMIANKNCKKIIALSKCNLKMQQDFLNYFPDYKATIENKMIHLTPPQKKLVERTDVEHKQSNQILKFLFVGKDFVRKGGREVVDVFYKIYEETDIQFELQLVSLGKTSNYAFGEFQDTEVEAIETKRKIDSCAWITVQEKVENNQLLKMMENCDVGLLPTWADTYGYSVLEFQASGCPVITTNIRALPEVNNDDIGWMIHLPVNEFNEIRIKNANEKLELREELQKKLEKTILNILEFPDQIKPKSLKAYDQVTEKHSLKKYMAELSKIYEENF